VARIICGVDQCSHNKSGVCHSNFVSIEGSSAKTDCDTSCSSFLDKAIYSKYKGIQMKLYIEILVCS
jgi:hypothetical protein